MKDLLKFIIILLLLACDIILTILFKENQTQTITLINPKPGIHVIEIPTNKEYIQIKIGNCSAGTLTVSLSSEMNNFEERKETK